jgi:hypothetical protein
LVPGGLREQDGVVLGLRLDDFAVRIVHQLRKRRMLF